MMKKIVLFAALIAISIAAGAQDFFDFSSNSHRYELGPSVGMAAWNTEYKARWGLGLNATVWGAYIDFINIDPQHKYDQKFSDTQWNDDSAFCINAGYQIPILPWLRLMPIVGYAQTNEGITDASTINVSSDGDGGGATLYHTYKVTPGTRHHMFNYGGGLSVQPLKWFSVNLVYTRYAIYGGISLNFLAFAD